MDADCAHANPAVSSAERSALAPSHAGGIHGLAAYPRAPLLAQFLKYAAVGVSNTLLTLAVYTLLVQVVGAWYLLASAVGFVVGAVNGFLLNRSWTFRGSSGDALAAARWGVVQGCGLGLDVALLYLCVHDAGLGKLPAQAVAIAVVVVLTFLVNRAWTFRVAPATRRQAPAAGSAPGRAGELAGP